MRRHSEANSWQSQLNSQIHPDHQALSFIHSTDIYTMSSRSRAVLLLLLIGKKTDKGAGLGKKETEAKSVRAHPHGLVGSPVFAAASGRG